MLFIIKKIGKNIQNLFFKDMKFKYYFRKASFKKDKIIICDDYDQLTYGVKKAVDELANHVSEIKELNKRLVRITV